MSDSNPVVKNLLTKLFAVGGVTIKIDDGDFTPYISHNAVDAERDIMNLEYVDVLVSVAGEKDAVISLTPYEGEDAVQDYSASDDSTVARILEAL